MILDMNVGRIGFLLAVNVILLVMGMLVDSSAVLMIAVPLLYPVAMQLGIRPIHFGIVCILNLSIIEEDNTFEHIAASIREAKAARERFGDGVQVLCGVEASEYFEDSGITRRLLALADYDVVIASVHRLEYRQWADFYSKIDFGEAFSERALEGWLAAYFESLLRVAEEADYDSLAHLTCPLRYINGKYRRNIGLEGHRAIVDEILRCVIRREKSLEINTSGVCGVYDSLMPDLSIIGRYFDLGGRLVTLGSDAHTPDRVGNAFGETADILSKIGFRGYCCYVQRRPQFISFAD